VQIVCSKSAFKFNLYHYTTGAAGARGRAAYIHRVWAHNGAGAVRAAFTAMCDDATRANTHALTAADFAGQRLRRVCAAALPKWSAAAKRSVNEKKHAALATAVLGRSMSLAAFSQWRMLPVFAEREMHMSSLARSFHRRRLAVSTLHHWWALYKFNAVDPELEGAWFGFNP
jgi:hypothetical protein